MWFPDGQLNVSYNCVDRWAEQDPDRVRNAYLFTLMFQALNNADAPSHRLRSSTKQTSPPIPTPSPTAPSLQKYHNSPTCFATASASNVEMS